jgi:hypothetical protein
LNERVDFRDVRHQPQPHFKGPVGQHIDEPRRNWAHYGLPLKAVRACRLLTLFHVRLPVLPSNPAIFLCDSGNAGFFLRDRPGDTQPPHLGQQGGPFQS